MTDGTGHSTPGYGPDGQLTSTTDGGGHVIGYHYNADGNPDKITYPNGHNITMAYNNGQQMTGITDWNSHAFGFGYGPDGNLTTQTDPNGDTATTTSNADGQITAITDKNSGGTTLAGFAYTRGSDGEPATTTTTGTALTATTRHLHLQLPRPAHRRQRRQLRLRPRRRPLDPHQPHRPGLHQRQRDRQPRHRRHHQHRLHLQPPRDRTTATTSQRHHQLRLRPGEPLTTYTPPACASHHLRLQRPGPAHRQNTSGTTTSYAWDIARSLPLMLTAGTTSYIYGPDGLPIETIASSGTPTYLFHDQLGSTRLLTSQAGTVTGTYTYDPWGNTTGHTGTATHLSIHRPVPRRRNRVLLPPQPLLRPRHRTVPHHRPPRQPNPAPPTPTPATTPSPAHPHA